MCHHTSAAKQPGRTDWPNLFFHHQMMRVDMDMDPARFRCVNLNVEPLRGRGAQPNQIQMRMEFMLRGACRRRRRRLPPQPDAAAACFAVLRVFCKIFTIRYECVWVLGLFILIKSWQHMP